MVGPAVEKAHPGRPGNKTNERRGSALKMHKPKAWLASGGNESSVAASETVETQYALNTKNS
ncbi:MAG TPA: hypothetical protein VIM11_06290 [Tepidisphaeraceae bacterium]|jgi:hypothetical protein